MTLKEFNDLSKKYLAGNTSEEEDRFLSEWQEQQPNDEELPLSKVEEFAIEKRIWKNINKGLNQEKIFTLKRLFIAAGIAATLLLGFIYFSPDLNSTKATQLSENKRQGIELKNTSFKKEKVKLEDGTVVELSENSSLIYGKGFNKSKREVYLKGEAFFEVERDVTRPFIVHTGELTTEVLGTSFKVKHNKKTRKVEVEVATGKVSVYNEKKSTKNKKNGVIITPNQKVIFDEVSENIEQSIVSNPKPLEKEKMVTSALVFTSIPLNKVLSQLSVIYGIDFVINNSKLQECKITADLNDLTMFTQLELICKSIDSSYEQRGSVIFINGEGC
ncbi:FecR family protein [uncultured Arcticibacterium sp.]|uniref:FecR family protein n=1 Tax=uncultured Arcticibacterium sp. TaxID=2173042 RepID=UPI0030F7C6AE